VTLVTDPTGQEPRLIPPPPPPDPAGPPESDDSYGWVAPVVISFLVVLVAGLCTLAVFVTTTIVGRVAHDVTVAAAQPPAAVQPPPFVKPTPAAPAPTPTALSFTCTSGCLDASTAGLMIPNESLQRTIPINRLRESASTTLTTAAAEYQADTGAWDADPPDGTDCLFVGSRSAVNPGRNGFDWTSDDPVALLGKNIDARQTATMTQTARFFTSPGFATDQMAWMRKQIDACNVTDPTVAAASGFELPSDVTAVAFVAEWDDATIFTYDFQRANTIVRFRVVAHGDLDENKVRHFLGTWVQTDLEQLPLN